MDILCVLKFTEACSRAPISDEMAGAQFACVFTCIRITGVHFARVFPIAGAAGASDWLTAGCWLLSSGWLAVWLLAAGCWLLAAGWLAAGCVFLRVSAALCLYFYMEFALLGLSLRVFFTGNPIAGVYFACVFTWNSHCLEPFCMCFL